MKKIKDLIGISDIKKELKLAISGFRDELDEHLTSINENTDEIQTNHSFIGELDEKIDKITQRLEKIELMLSVPNKNKTEIEPLTVAEKKIFLVLYTEEAPLTFETISKRTEISPSMIKIHISRLIEKGIPLIKSYIGGRAFLKLNRDFKDRQAKENLVDSSLKAYVPK